MAKRSQLPQLDEHMFPRMPFKLKDVPLENANSERLDVCKKCQGDGEICTAKKETTKTSGAIHREEATIRKDEVKKYQRGFWRVACEPCGQCAGSGYVKVGGINE
ncbi:hypothetical protein [Bradyrhizobium manausense]|uniref:hypothetical protein n=1 Tax=Bradyrhizobium manausense TaxID=989370 RepID=UPI001BADBC32|nr:hypothetical protein [Bradyrhizobium manausense]MBR0721780.1 hypothetical protein [Bradyrhizobium manausense]